MRTLTMKEEKWLEFIQMVFRGELTKSGYTHTHFVGDILTLRNSVRRDRDLVEQSTSSEVAYELLASY